MCLGSAASDWRSTCRRASRHHPRASNGLFTPALDEKHCLAQACPDGETVAHYLECYRANTFNASQHWNCCIPLGYCYTRNAPTMSQESGMFSVRRPREVSRMRI